MLKENRMDNPEKLALGTQDKDKLNKTKKTQLQM